MNDCKQLLILVSVINIFTKSEHNDFNVCWCALFCPSIEPSVGVLPYKIKRTCVITVVVIWFYI